MRTRLLSYAVNIRPDQRAVLYCLIREVYAECRRSNGEASLLPYEAELREHRHCPNGRHCSLDRMHHPLRLNDPPGIDFRVTTRAVKPLGYSGENLSRDNILDNVAAGGNQRKPGWE